MTISTLADGIQEIAEIHAQTRALVKANGFTIADNAGMAEIPRALQTLHAIAPDPLWPDLLEGYVTGTFRGLVKVEEHPVSGDNWVALLVVGGEYMVDWGDGTSGTYSNNTQAKHRYTYSNSNLTTVNQFKVAVITVTCTSSITKLDLAQLPSELNGYAGYVSNWLDLAANIPTMTTFNLGQSLDIVRHFNLAKVSSLNASALTNTSSMFNYCVSLVRLTLPFTTSFSVQRAALGTQPLNDMFTALGNTNGGICTIGETPGRLTCTPSIATAKGWTVTV